MKKYSSLLNSLRRALEILCNPDQTIPRSLRNAAAQMVSDFYEVKGCDDDTIQELFARLMKRPRDWQAIEQKGILQGKENPIEAYLCTMANNLCKDKCTNNEAKIAQRCIFHDAPEEEQPFYERVADPAILVEQALIDVEEARDQAREERAQLVALWQLLLASVLHHASAQKTPKGRSSFLRDFCRLLLLKTSSLPLEQMAQELGMTRNALEKQLSRARSPFHRLESIFKIFLQEQFPSSLLASYLSFLHHVLTLYNRVDE